MSTSPADGGSSTDTRRSSENLCLRDHKHVSEDEELWGKKLVLSFDGGGVRGYASLLILKHVMIKIQELEGSTEDGNNPVKFSRSYPWSSHDNTESNGHAPHTESLDDFLPCHYFDYIAGTSTGGLSAIMLGRLRMSVDEALREYTTFGNEIFGKPRLFHTFSILWLPRSKFSSKKTQDAFKTFICNKLYRSHPDESSNTRKQRITKAAGEEFQSPEVQTKTLAFSHQMKEKAGFERTYIWRTYRHRSHGGDTDDANLGRSGSWKPLNPQDDNPRVRIWQVACATSAAPPYFSPILIDNNEHVDGGVHANNPSRLTLTEVQSQHPNHKPELFLSIGTGLKHNNSKDQDYSPDNGGYAESSAAATRINIKEMRRLRNHKSARKSTIRRWMELGRYGVRQLSEKENANSTWWELCKAQGIDHRYRLDVGGSLSRIPLDEWLPRDSGRETLEKIEIQTARFLGQSHIIEDTDRLARHLVEIRRLRAATERWEVFALDLDYVCPVDGCRKGSCQTRDGLRNHFQKSSDHAEMRDLGSAELEAWLDQGRRGDKNGHLKYSRTMSRKFTGYDP